MTALLVERDGPIVWATLNRPDRLNALNTEIFESLTALLERERTTDSKVIILRGAGRAFSAGHDLGSDSNEVTQPGDAVDDRDRQASYIEAALKIFDHPKPVIAAIHGYCIGGSTQLALFADFVIAAEDARISASPMLPLGGGFITPLLSYRIGVDRAKLMSYSPGFQITGKTAADWGFAIESVPEAELFDRARELALSISRTPSSVLHMKKVALNRTLEIQGFRTIAFIGAETDVVVHGADEVKAYKALIEKQGLKETLRAYKAGEI